ncbi:MAG TPA: hypothetical protein VL576_01005 [Candidatus Paceibacterota bacterium]|jgi:hypothetical protein|nr:hypothetical protein [Candidatus Paceibacterota bacterium]
MKISNLQLKIDAKFATLMADCFIRPFGPDKIYFKFDKKYVDFIALDMSPFAAALLIPSMKLGSNLIIEGEISEQLYKGLHEAMELVFSWNIGLKKIKIVANSLKKDTYKPAAAASFFSGGVDSFYTYLKNKNNPAVQKIQYFILANGYDISLRNKNLWERSLATVENVADHEGIELITVESNVRHCIEPILTWDYTHGGCLAALGLALRKEINNVYIASTYTKDQQYPNGTHLQLDGLWGTEVINFHHDGTETNRLGKTKYIAHEQIVLENLRVCYLNKRGKFNCGLCDKCNRTMIGLHIAGTLEQSKTFPRSIDLQVVKNLRTYTEDGAAFQMENLLDLNKMESDKELRDALQESISKSFAHPHTGQGRKVLEKIWFYDYYYTRSRLYKVASLVRNK